jgi:hypothetical protein
VTGLRALRPLVASGSPAERVRGRLLALAVAVAGALLIAAARLAALPDAAVPDVAVFVEEPGLRVGVVAGAVLLVLPAVLLGAQAVRLGGAERARRLAALRLAGATPGQRRAVTALRTGRAGLLGGVLAGPAHGLLWVLVGLLPPAPARLLPPPRAADLAVWAAVVVLGGLAGALVGALTAGARTRSRPRAVRPLPLVLAGTAVATALFSGDGAALVVAAVAVTAAVAVLRRPLALRVAGLLDRRGGAVDVLAAARLRADPGAAGRSAAVLGLCGTAFGVQGAFAATVLGHPDVSFYAAGIGLAATATLVAVAVALLSGVLAAVDQAVGERRSVAALAALGADGDLQRAVLRRQLTAVALPVALAGCVAGLAVLAGRGPAEEGSAPSAAAVGVLVAALPLTAAVVVLVSRLAVGLVARPLRAAADPVHLRAA